MRRQHSLAISLVLVAAALTTAALVGCGDDGDAPPAEGGAAIEYVRTGGLAGVGERLEIGADGRATLLTGGDAGPPRRFNVPAQQAEGVRQTLDDADFAGLPTDEDRSIPEPDGFNYAIRRPQRPLRRQATREMDVLQSRARRHRLPEPWSPAGARPAGWCVR